MKHPVVTALGGFILQCAAAGAWACSVSATGLNFTAINPVSGNAYDSTATITITCPQATSFTVSLSPGSGSFGQRTMLSGSHTLQYNLFIDAAMTQIWGDGTAGTSTWGGTADSSGVSKTVYGHVPNQPAAYPGTYVDPITITVSY